MNFVFFGDSICVGQYTSPHLTWVSRVSVELHQQTQGHEIMVSNSSVNGHTTRLALERIGNDLQVYRPQIVFVQFGLNDCNCWMSDDGHPRVSLGAYRANLHEIVDRARLFGAAAVLLATNHLTQVNGPVEPKQAPNASESYRARIREYNDVLREVAKVAATRLIDVEKAWLAGPEKVGQGEAMLAPDGLHLSAKGHSFYFNLMSPICLEAARQLLPKS